MSINSRFKIWWFAGLLILLLLVTILCLISSLLLSSIFRNLGLPLFIISLLIGYTWAVYIKLPFFQSRTKRQRVLISAAIALLPLFVACVCLFVSATQFLQDFRYAKFASPANPANEVCFYDRGVMERGLSLYVKPEGQRVRLVSNLVWWPDVGFSYAQWTRDGQAIVCLLIVKINGKYMQVMATGFDFNKNKAIAPSWMIKSSYELRPESDWKKQESIIKEIVAAHGGLSDQKIDDDLLEKNEKTLWFWQKPYKL